MKKIKRQIKLKINFLNFLIKCVYKTIYSRWNSKFKYFLDPILVFFFFQINFTKSILLINFKIKD